MSVSEKPVIKRSSNNSSQQLNFRWDKGDIFQYYNMTYDMLRAVNAPLFLMYDNDGANLSKRDILHCVNGFYRNIVHVLHGASCSTIPRKRHNFYKYWWDEELSLLKQKAIASFRLWSALGKPRVGSDYDAMRHDKLTYKCKSVEEWQGCRG